MSVAIPFYKKKVALALQKEYDAVCRMPSLQNIKMRHSSLVSPFLSNNEYYDVVFDVARSILKHPYVIQPIKKGMFIKVLIQFIQEPITDKKLVVKDDVVVKTNVLHLMATAAAATTSLSDSSTVADAKTDSESSESDTGYLTSMSEKEIDITPQNKVETVDV